MAWERSGVPGAGSTRTSWFERDTPAMWRTLENQESDDHWRLVAGWRKAAELTASHLRRLEQYRAHLADAWPPDRNAAAAAYVSRLDFLIDNVRATHDVAAANYSTLAATVGALAQARHNLAPLHDEWQAKARAIRQHGELAAFNAASEAPTAIGPPPATAHDLERLNNRARAIMYELSHTLVEAEAAIRQPPTYPSAAFRDPGNPDVYGSLQPSGTDTNEFSSISSKGLTEAASDNIRGIVPTPSDNLQAALGRSRSIGSSTTAPQLPTDSLGRLGRPDSISGAAEKPSVRVSMAGGVIGTVPPDARDHTSREAVRVNPVGGVISNSRMNAQHSTVPPLLSPLVTNQPDRSRQRARSGKADTNWEVPKGVPGVIVPRETSPFDPGPAIGLSP